MAFFALVFSFVGVSLFLFAFMTVACMVIPRRAAGGQQQKR